MSVSLSRSLFVSTLVLALGGCIPVPKYKTLQPAAEITVRDAGGQPVPDATVQLITGAYPRAPQGWERGRATAHTGADGVARFEAQKEWLVEVSGMVHGVTDYDWHWCVAHPGYRTWRTDVDAVPFEAKTSVVLQGAQSPADAVSCESQRAYGPGALPKPAQ